MTNKMMSSTLALALLTGTLTACGGSATTTKEPAKGAESAPAVSNEPIELNFYSIANGADTKDFDDKYGNLVRKKFPNITVKVIPNLKGNSISSASMSEVLASGTPIDIYYESVGQFVEGLVNNNMQLDMTDLIKKANVDLARFEPSTIEAIKTISKGGIYGLPVNNLTLALYYNKDIFDKFGVPYLKDGMNWDELIEVSKKLTRNEGGAQYVGLATSPAHVLRLNPFSLPYIDPKTEKPTILDEKWKPIFQNNFMRAAEAPGYVEKMKSLGNKLPAGNELTKEKSLAIYIGLNNIFTNPSTAEELAQMNWDMVSVPTFKELPGVGAQTYPIYMSVTSSSKHKEAAMEVIKYLTSDEVQMEYSKNAIMSVLTKQEIKNAYGQNNRFKDKNLKSIFFNKFAPISPKTLYDGTAETTYRKDMIDLVTGAIDINTAFRKADEATNKAITDLKKK
jgi:multiple sugar transport system substrate-binding protein